jgi:hypothetical protein
MNMIFHEIHPLRGFCPHLSIPIVNQNRRAARDSINIPLPQLYQTIKEEDIIAIRC